MSKLIMMDRYLLILIILCVNNFVFSNVIRLDDFISNDELEYIYRYGTSRSFVIKQDNIYVSGRKFVYCLTEKGHLNKYSVIAGGNVGAVSIAVGKSLLIAHSFNPNDGRYYLIILNKNGERIAGPVSHHSKTGKLFINETDLSIIIAGDHFTNYIMMLDKYDENSFTPSAKSISGINRFFQSEKAYTLTKYDLNLNLIDSCDIINRQGKNFRGYNDLYLRNATDYDLDGNIYTVHESSGYLIRKYGYDFTLLKEFNCNNDNYKSVSENMNRDRADRMRNVPNTFSNIYSINVINDTIITSFYQNPKNWELPNPPFYYDTFNQSGEKLQTGTIPYRIFTRDDRGNLYFLIKKEGSWPFGKDQYFLVSFTLHDLIDNRVNEAFVDRAIDSYLNKE